jgi:SH3 domain-containing YSC84-like protein 1
VVTGGSWGAQIGAESVDLVMLIMNDKGMEHLLSSKFQLGGEAGVAAGPVGRQGAAQTDATMNAEVLTYSRAKGVFAGIDLGGAVIKTDEDAMRAYYGKDVTFRAALTGQVPAPPEARPFLAVVRNATQGTVSAAAH